MTEAVFKNWFIVKFLDQVEQRPILLIYDGHLSHISIDLVESAIASQVTILKMPPHTSHLLQPLDVSVFKGVKTRWDSLLADWARQNYGKNLSKSVFSNIFAKVWTSVSSEVIKRGFEKTGIFDQSSEFPVNKNKIEEKNFDPEKLARYKLLNENPGEIPQMEIEIEVISGQIPPNISQDINKIHSLPSPGKSFESLLLKTVSPVPSCPPKKKRRIDEAEIITQDDYLKILKDQEILKKEALEKKMSNSRGKKKDSSGKIPIKINKIPNNQSKPSKEVVQKKRREKRCTF